MSKYKFNLSWVFKKIALLTLISISILFTAASCNWNPLAKNPPPVILGMLKQDLSVKTDGFGKINSVKAINGKVDNDGLTNLSALKITQVDANLVFVLTKEKGVFRSSDAGKSWQRIYIFPVFYTEDKDKVKEMEASFQRNDEVQITNFWVDFEKPDIIYFSAKDGNVGKVFKTVDGGKNVREVYVSAGEESSSIDFVVISPLDGATVYALTSKNTLIQSIDGGLTWRKINDYTKDKDKIIQIGIFPTSKQFFTLSEKNGFSTSVDGISWTKKKLTKTVEDAQNPTSQDTRIEQIQRRFLPQTLPAFKQYQKIIPVVSTSEPQKESMIVLADKEIWYTDEIDTGNLTQIKNLPVEGDKVQIQDIAVDPVLGLQKIYVASGSRILMSDNGGETWSNKKIGVDNIGVIARISVDKTNPDTIYLALRR
jgi:photosystem II stability/assembly factor-like uncharacterized protein